MTGTERETTKSRYLTADEAASALGIQVASLYAYVSRGLLRSEPAGDGTRTRRYLAEDVQRLQRRQRARRDPAQAAEPPLTWGGPVLDSAITLIDQGRLYYRGHDAVDLALTWTIEDVAELLWTGELDSRVPAAGEKAGGWRHLSESTSEATPPGLDPIGRFLRLLPLLAADDPAAYDLRPETVARQGARILRRFVSVVGGDGGSSRPMSALLQEHLAPAMPDAKRLLDAALILCADHELNVSSFTVRCIASAGAPLYAAVSGGLAAILGSKHGGASLAVEALFDDARRLGSAQAALSQRLRRGEPLPGFGHRLYTGGDPRAACLLALLDATAPANESVELGREIAALAAELSGEQPNVEFALVTLACLLRAGHGTALTLMALGRTVGWVAHAIEEYRRDELIRPRARYVGPLPGTAASA